MTVRSLYNPHYKVLKITLLVLKHNFCTCMKANWFVTSEDGNAVFQSSSGEILRDLTSYLFSVDFI